MAPASSTDVFAWHADDQGIERTGADPRTFEPMILAMLLGQSVLVSYAQQQARCGQKHDEK